MRHNIALADETSETLDQLCQLMGLRPAAVISLALRELMRKEMKERKKNERA